MSTLSLRNLRKAYGTTAALDGIDIEVEDGEFFVLLGPSGAGKTTTLKAVAGLVDLDAGTVSIGGHDMTGVEPNHRHVAMAFENYALYPHLTNYDNIAFPLRSPRYRTGEAEILTRIDRVTKTLGIHHLLGRQPAELSGGQRQRVALARVLVRPADVLLLDEPLSHLDAKLRATMRAELKSLGELQRTTTLYVTHDYLEALALGDRIAVLDRGKLRQVGTREEIWNHPVDTFVARTFGQPEINLIDGAIADSDGDVTFRSIDGVLEVALPVRPPGIGASATLGLRPRDLTIVTCGDAPPGSATLAGRVYIAEPLGRQIEVTVDVGAIRLVAVVDRQDVDADDVVTVALPLAKALVFDGETGRRVDLELDTSQVPIGAPVTTPADDLSRV